MGHKIDQKFLKLCWEPLPVIHWCQWLSEMTERLEECQRSRSRNPLLCSALCSQRQSPNGKKWKHVFLFLSFAPLAPRWPPGLGCFKKSSRYMTNEFVWKKDGKSLEHKPFGDLEDLPQGGSEDGRDSGPQKKCVPRYPALQQSKTWPLRKAAEHLPCRNC